MIAYISLGFFTPREQELISQRPLLEHFIEYTDKILRKVTGCGAKGIIYSNPFDPPFSTDIPCHYTIIGPRREKEIELIESLMLNKKTEDWILFIRPACGWVSQWRLQNFVDGLSKLTAPCANSLIPLSPLGNPAWNCDAALCENWADGSVRQPHRGENFKLPLVELCPDLLDRTELGILPEGSQTLDEKYLDDTAVFGIRHEKLGQISISELNNPAPIFFDGDKGRESPWFHRLPIFEVSKSQIFDFKPLAEFSRCTYKKGSIK